MSIFLLLRPTLAKMETLWQLPGEEASIVLKGEPRKALFQDRIEWEVAKVGMEVAHQRIQISMQCHGMTVVRKLGRLVRTS